MEREGVSISRGGGLGSYQKKRRSAQESKTKIEGEELLLLFVGKGKEPASLLEGGKREDANHW